jgi:hypothetical protein
VTFAEVEADAAPVWTAVLADLVPDEVRLIPEAPGAHHVQSLRKERIGDPEIEVRPIGDDVRHGEVGDFLEAHRLVAGEAHMLWGDLARAVLEAPGRVGQHGLEPETAREGAEGSVGKIVHEALRILLGRADGIF